MVTECKRVRLNFSKPAITRCSFTCGSDLSESNSCDLERVTRDIHVETRARERNLGALLSALCRTSHKF